MQVYDTQPDATQAVLSGRAYATLGGNTTIVYAAIEEPAVRRRPRAQGHARALGGAVAQEQRRRCATELQDVLDCMKKDGTIAKLSEKWFGREAGARRPRAS